MRAKNPDASTDPNYTGTVYLGSTASRGAFPSPHTFSAADQGATTLSETLGSWGSQLVTASDVPVAGLVGWWKLDEGTGTSISDSSGFGQTGELICGWSTDVPAPLAPVHTGSLSFSGIGKMARIVKSPAQLTTSYTLSLWIKTKATPVYSTTILSDAIDGTRGYALYYSSAGTLLFGIYKDNFFRNMAIENSNIIDDTWHQVAVTVDSGTRTMAFFLDGVLRHSEPFWGLDEVLPSSHDLCLGNFCTNLWEQGFDGLADDLRIYNRALSAAEVAAVASHAGRSGSAALTVAPGAPASVTPLAGTPQGAYPGTLFALPFTVRVTDWGGNPLPGVAVSFSAPQQGPSGSFTDGLTTVERTTDSAGETTTTPFTANQTTGSYTVTASSSSATPALFSLTNYLAPEITLQPQPTTSIAGQVPQIFVTVGTNGSQPLSFQWYRGERGDTGNPVPGATSAAFDKPLYASTRLWVRVTEFVTILDSESAQVTVLQPPAVTLQPRGALLAAGQSTTLTVGATGDGILAYQWYQGSTGDTSHPASGATGTSFITPPFASPTWYWVRVTSEYGHADSAAARLTGSSFGSLGYASNSEEASLTVIEIATNQAVATIPTAPKPWGIAVHPEGERVYLSHATSPGRVSVFGRGGKELIAELVLTQNVPRGILLSPDGGRLYLANEGSDSVSVIDTASLEVVATVAVGSQPSALAVHPDGSRVYVANTKQNSITVIDSASNAASDSIALSGSPRDLAISATGRLYLVNALNDWTDEIATVDTATNQVSASYLFIGGHNSVAISPDGSLVYFSNGVDNSVMVMGSDLSSYGYVGGVPNRGRMSVTPDGTKLLVPNFSGNSVTVIDARYLTVSPTAIPVGAGPVTIGLPWDSTPDPFRFYPRNDLPPGGSAISNPVAVAGIDVPSYVRVTAGEYAVNGGAFTSAPGLVRNGDSIAVRVGVPEASGSGRAALLTVGSRSELFSVTTPADPGGAPAAALSFSPSPLVFTDRTTGSTSAARQVTLTSSGNAPLRLDGFTLEGSHPGDFTMAWTTCRAGTVLQPGASCALEVTFTPGASCGREAALAVRDSAGGSPHLVRLQGGGTTAQPAPPITYQNAGKITLPITIQVPFTLITTATVPYPSEISVSGVTGVLTKVRAKLQGLSVPILSYLRVLLVGPQGQKVVLMNRSGGWSTVDDMALSFDDDGAPMPSYPVSGGTYRPSDNDSYFTFPSPAPGRPYGTSLASLAGTDPNGTWQLYATFDATMGFPDIRIERGWQLELTMASTDLSPEPFDFPPATGAPGTPVVSEAVRITGITTPSPISLSGADGSLYAVSSDAGSTWSAWSATVPGSVNPGDRVRLQVTSATQPGAVKSAILEVGGVRGTFRVTSEAAAPQVASFSMPASAGSLAVPVRVFTAQSPVAVTGWMITENATPPAASDPGWRSVPPPEFRFAGTGARTAYPWVRDALGKVSPVFSQPAQVSITSLPVLTLSALSDGARTPAPVINLTGYAECPDGIASLGVSLNGGAALPLEPEGFSKALRLSPGENSVGLNALSGTGQLATLTRRFTYDPGAPGVTVYFPPDGSTFNLNTRGTITVEGTFEQATASAVRIRLNGGVPVDAFTAGDGFMLPVTLAHGLNTIEVLAVGASRTGSAKRSVVAGYDLPTLALADPLEDTLTSNTVSFLAGTIQDASAPVNLRVAVDGALPVPVTLQQGVFRYRLDLTDEREYQVKADATDAWGRSASVTRSIIREREPQLLSFFLGSPVSYGTGPIPLSATNSSGLPISFGSSNPSVASVTGSTLTIAGAGNSTITASHPGTAWHKPASVSVPLQVEKAPLTVRADAKSRALGEENPPLSASYIGFLRGDDAAVLSGTPALATTAVAGSPAGSYPITIGTGTLSAANYQLSFLPGVLSVLPVYNLKLSLSGNGRGTVVYQEQSVACSGGCSSYVTPGSHVTLIPVPSDYSRFSGWSGACSASSGNCSFAMSGNRSAAARFDFDNARSVRTDGLPERYYPSIVAAYADARTTSGTVLRMWGISFPEQPVFDQQKTVSFIGGYDGGYTYTTGSPTVVASPLRIRRGTITLRNVVIR